MSSRVPLWIIAGLLAVLVIFYVSEQQRQDDCRQDNAQAWFAGEGDPAHPPTPVDCD